MTTDLHCYVCGAHKHRDDFYADATRHCGKSSKCKVCADRRVAFRKGYSYTSSVVSGWDKMTDREYIEKCLEARKVDYVPTQVFNGAYKPDGVRSVRGKTQKNRPKKQIWGNKIR